MLGANTLPHISLLRSWRRVLHLNVSLYKSIIQLWDDQEMLNFVQLLSVPQGTMNLSRP